MLDFVKGFLCIYWDNHMVFVFQFVNVVYYIDWFADIEGCKGIPGIKPTWSWCMIFLMCCWILIARILFRIFASMFISDIKIIDSVVKNRLPRGVQVQSLGQEDSLEKEMATQSSTLAWEILWTEEPGGLQSMGSDRVLLNQNKKSCSR